MDFNARMDRTLLSLMPDIRRAREFRLYDAGGRRFLDAYLDSGAALLGHRPAGLANTLKNELDRGGFAALPSSWSRRCDGAIAALLPGYPVRRIYISFEKALEAIAPLGVSEAVDDVLRFPSSDSKPSEGIVGPRPRAALWRPFLPGQGDADILLPVLPFPLWPAPQVVLFRDDPGNAVPPSDVISPFWLSGLASTAFSLIAYAKTYGEPLWKRFELSARNAWTRRGPYLYPRCSASGYLDFFRDCLASGILPSPDYRFPSIVPGIFSSGDLQGLRKKTSGNGPTDIDGANGAAAY
jgi:hypothetical protein